MIMLMWARWRKCVVCVWVCVCVCMCVWVWVTDKGCNHVEKRR